ncbi:MAG TPA: GNAT family N-acetyltransferase [Rheinheimera sp.]|nr:GNAT family N-acetyltransferase [Rheinheimera sp.]
MQALDASLIDVTTQNLRIRELAQTDKELYTTLYTSKDVMKYICAPLSLEKACQSFMYSLKLNSDVTSSRMLLTISLSDNEDPIGLCSVSHFDRENKIAELGCIIAPGTQRNNIAKQALAILASKLSELLDVVEFTLDIHPDNLAAVRLADSLGYTKCPARETIYRKKILTV